ncbi:MAG: hypothetical protein JRH20_32040 [Deltaproteobacteria bacterium]|nr:hypothetical protein [Deltaproteobacteria bacterium]
MLDGQITLDTAPPVDGPSPDATPMDGGIDANSADATVDSASVDSTVDTVLVCPTGSCKEGADCLTEKTVSCDTDPNRPAHAEDVPENVTVQCQANGTFQAPSFCAWNCSDSYCLHNLLCVQNITALCDTQNNNPANSHDLQVNVTLACQDDGSFPDAAPCAWECDANYVLDTTSSTCLASPTCPDGGDLNLDVDSNGTPDCEENMLTNGQFARDTIGWTWSVNSNTVTWRDEDAEGTSNSGSVSVSELSYGAGGYVNGPAQCVLLDADTTYTMWGKFYIPSGQAGGSPRAGFGIFLYSTDNCLGTIASIATSPDWSSPTDSWVPKQHSFTNTTAKSARIRLNVVNPAGTTAALYIYYDSMLLHP